MAINNFNVGVGTTSQLTRYRYVATGGETSISGADADGKTLSYTVGLEQVFLNGVNLVRGQDYTATNGTSIGNLTALVASDSLEVFAYVPFNIANALTVSTVDAKGDLLVGTGADTVGRLAVGTNGQLLSAASGETSGLKWANGGLTLIKTQTIGTTVSSVSIDNVFTSTYDSYKVIVDFAGATNTNSTNVTLRLRVGGVDADGSNYTRRSAKATSASLANSTETDVSSLFLADIRTSFTFRTAISLEVISPAIATSTKFLSNSFSDDASANFGLFLAGMHTNATAYDGFTLTFGAGTVTGGKIRVYGYNQ